MSASFDMSKQTTYDKFDSTTLVLLICEAISNFLPVFLFKKLKHYFKLIVAIKTIQIDKRLVIEQVRYKYFNLTVLSILKILKK